MSAGTDAWDRVINNGGTPEEARKAQKRANSLEQLKRYKVHRAMKRLERVRQVEVSNINWYFEFPKLDKKDPFNSYMNYLRSEFEDEN